MAKKSGRGKPRKVAAAGARKGPQPKKKTGQVNREPIEQPTPEMTARVTFDLITITDEMGKALGRGYRRRPLFETMRTKGAISPDEVDALRFYRTAHDRCEYSPMKSCLNVEHSGGGFSAAQAVFRSTPAILAARRNLRLCEARLGHSLGTMRAVALEDLSFSELAIRRYGCREKDGKVLPKSGRDRARVKDEFQAGLLMLTDVVRSLTTQAGVEEIWIFPEEDGTATIRRGLVAPVRTYRCWGDSEKLDTIMADLRKRWGGALRFDNPVLARAALDDADAGRLNRLEPEELAA